MAQANSNTVAIVDDDPIFLDYLSTLLEIEGGFNTLKATNAAELFAILNQQSVGCLVVDNDLGIESGLTIGQSVKEYFPDPPPMIMLTGTGSERLATKAFRIGFSDYVTKRNLITEELMLAVRSARQRRQEEEAREAEIAHLRRNEHFDGLTGLHSVDYVERRMKELCSGASDRVFSMVVVSPGSVSQVRRELGHVAADRLIETFAKLLMQSAAGSALCGHISSETFVCVYEGPQSEAAARAACDHFAGALSFESEIGSSKVTSIPEIGLAMHPADGKTPAELVEAAVSGKHQATLEADRSDVVSDPKAVGASVSDRRQTEIQIDGDRRETQRRAALRRRVLKQGKILIGSLGASVDCAVRDISDTGARLRVASFFMVPNHFNLLIVGETPRPVVKRWQTGLDLGIEYVTE